MKLSMNALLASAFGSINGHRPPHFVPRERDQRTPEQVERRKADAQAKRERKKLFRLRQAGANQDLLDGGIQDPSTEGGWRYPCRVCGEDTDIFVGPFEFDPDSHWCGRQPQCSP